MTFRTVYIAFLICVLFGLVHITNYFHYVIGFGNKANTYLVISGFLFSAHLYGFDMIKVCWICIFQVIYPVLCMMVFFSFRPIHFM